MHAEGPFRTQFTLFCCYWEKLVWVQMTLNILEMNIQWDSDLWKWLTGFPVLQSIPMRKLAYLIEVWQLSVLVIS